MIDQLIDTVMATLISATLLCLLAYGMLWAGKKEKEWRKRRAERKAAKGTS